MNAFDSAISEWLFSLSSIGSFSWLWVLFARLSIYFLVFLFLFVLIRYRTSMKERLFFVLFLLFQFIISWGLITQTLSFLTARVRPFSALSFEPLFYTLSHTAAFPSGHTVSMFGIVAVIFLIHKKTGLWAGALALLSALSRVISGVHWVGDVIGGIVIALGVVFILWYLWGHDLWRKIHRDEEKSM